MCDEMYIFPLALLATLQLVLSGLSNPSCDEVEDRVAESDRNTVILFPPPLVGTWVSEKCETRTGPEYLLRWQRYTENETYTAILHRYRDVTCSVPWFSSLYRGKAGLRGRSWLAPSAAQADFTVESVVLVAHSQKGADEMSAILNTSCPGLVARRWRAHTEYTIFTSKEAADLVDKEGLEWSTVSPSCLKPLRLSQEEGGLIRVQVRPPGLPDSTAKRTELLLAEAKPKSTNFHMPLLFVTQAADCEICASVERSTVHNPPRLSQTGAGNLQMAGEWVSTRCEVRPMGLFLRRRLRVSGRSWQADFNFFSDPTCTGPTLTASAEGTLTEVSTRRIAGATDYDFKVLRAFLTLHDEGLAASLSRDTTCGPPGPWQIGVRKDVTPSEGCPALGISVPTTEYELVRLELDPSGQALLYLGQSEQRKGQKKQRPTSFQPPLLQCNAPELPPLTHFLNSYNGATTSSLSLPIAVFVVLIL